MVLPNPRQTYKAQLLNYDALLEASDAECCFSLSEREVQMLLGFVDYVGWKTRYIATETEIDLSIILRWQGNLARKLMSGCCPDDETLSRFTEDGVFQTSDDGGETWTDNPGADPRNDGIEAPPLGGEGDSTRCAAADNARDQFKAIKDQLVELLTAGTTVLAIIAGLIGALGILLGLTGAATGIGVLLFGLAAGLLALTPEEVEAQIDSTALDALRCILYCHCEPNGQWTYEDWQAVITDIDTDFSGFPQTFFHGLAAAMGYVGLSNAGTVGTATATDCDDCEPCVESCADKFSVTTGTFIGEFSGYLRYGAVATGGAMVVQINTSGADECCQLLDFHDVVGGANISSRYHILCGLAIEGGNIAVGWGLEGCYNFLACQTTVGDGTYFEVEFLLNFCD